MNSTDILRMAVFSHVLAMSSPCVHIPLVSPCESKFLIGTPMSLDYTPTYRPQFNLVTFFNALSLNPVTFKIIEG